jgi:hypothetical protein
MKIAQRFLGFSSIGLKPALLPFLFWACAPQVEVVAFIDPTVDAGGAGNEAGVFAGRATGGADPGPGAASGRGGSGGAAQAGVGSTGSGAGGGTGGSGSGPQGGGGGAGGSPRSGDAGAASDGSTYGGSSQGGSASTGGVDASSCPPHTACPTGACLAGFADCVANASDGCETEILNSNDNCGSCGRRCIRGAVLGKCVGGECVFEDGAGGAPGGAGEGGAASESACTGSDLMTDEAHCGDCETVCEAGIRCIGGLCVSSPCAGLCDTWTTVPHTADGYRIESLSTAERCFENVGYAEEVEVPRILCWEFASGRTLDINGVSVPCQGEPGAELTMPTRAGGYCIHVGAGDFEFAGFRLPVPSP